MPRLRLDVDSLPFHRQVYADLRAAMDRGAWRPGDRLPPERELAKQYGCSLITVRHALSELAREQRIERTRGRGTFVLRQRIDHDFAGALSFDAEMQRRGLDPETRVVTSRVLPADERVAAALEIPLGADVTYLERLRMAAGDPLLLEQVHLSADRFPDLLTYDLERNSLYDLLAERYGTQVVRSREAIEPILLRKREAELLGLRPRTPALIVEGVAFAQNGEPVEAARSYVAGERSRYSIERTVVRSRWEQRRVVAPPPMSAAEEAAAAG